MEQSVNTNGDNVPVPPGNTPAAGRGPDGKFLPGHSGNPKGRPIDLGKKALEELDPEAKAWARLLYRHAAGPEPFASLKALITIGERRFGKVAEPVPESVPGSLHLYAVQLIQRLKAGEQPVQAIDATASRAEPRAD